MKYKIVSRKKPIVVRTTSHVLPQSTVAINQNARSIIQVAGMCYTLLHPKDIFRVHIELSLETELYVPAQFIIILITQRQQPNCDAVLSKKRFTRSGKERVKDVAWDFTFLWSLQRIQKNNKKDLNERKKIGD